MFPFILIFLYYIFDIVIFLLKTHFAVIGENTVFMKNQLISMRVQFVIV